MEMPKAGETLGRPSTAALALPLPLISRTNSIPDMNRYRAAEDEKRQVIKMQTVDKALEKPERPGLCSGPGVARFVFRAPLVPCASSRRREAVYLKYQPRFTEGPHCKRSPK